MHAVFETTRSGSRRRPPAAGGFSLLEIMIAIGILGIGLVMVAAIFPVALDQHRTSTDEVMADLVAGNAGAYLSALLKPPASPTDPNKTAVRVHPFFTLDLSGAPQDLDSGGLGYTNALNVGAAPGIWTSFAIQDIVYPSPSLALWPPTGVQTFQAGTDPLDRQVRYMWMAFLRTDQAESQNYYTVVVCRRGPGDRFAQQDTTALTTPPGIVRPLVPVPTSNDVLLPLPWRIQVQRLPDPANAPPLKQFRMQLRVQNIARDTSGAVAVDQLVPRGAPMISQATGKIYTVVSVNNRPAVIDVLEDVSAEPRPGSNFELWFVPAAVTWDPTGTMAFFDRRSPIVGVSAF